MDVSDIFYFFLLGGGEGGVEALGKEGGGDFLRENPRSKGSLGLSGARGGLSTGGCFQGIWGGGAPSKQRVLGAEG